MALAAQWLGRSGDDAALGQATRGLADAVARHAAFPAEAGAQHSRGPCLGRSSSLLLGTAGGCVLHAAHAV